MQGESISTRRKAAGGGSETTSTSAHERYSTTIGNPTANKHAIRSSTRIARKYNISVPRNSSSSLLYTLLGITGIGMVLWSRGQTENGGQQHSEVLPNQPPLILTMRRNNPHFFTETKKREPMIKAGRAYPGEGGRDSHVGDRSKKFLAIQKRFQELYPDNETARQRRLDLVKGLRKRAYYPISPEEFDNDRDCPMKPDKNYPKAWRTIDIVSNWGPDDTTPKELIFQGICIFDYNKPGDVQKAFNYREAELPFVMRDDPEVLKSVERWNDPSYLKSILEGETHRAEYSENNHFMYWNGGVRAREAARRNGWSPPTKMIEMTYDDWLSKANVTDDKLGVDNPHWYFRLIGCGEFRNCDKFMSEWLFDDLSFFFPKETLYIVEPKEQKGIHCRFGMKGVIAENHFDGSRNAIALLGGERRYILSHPDECLNLALLPKDHPSGRHSAVDWSNPDLLQYPQFKDAKSNEVVLQAGDVLYLPTNW